MIGPRLVNKPLVLYGKGNLGKLAAEIFDELAIPYTMIDKYDRYPKVGHGGVLVAVCVAMEPYGPIKASLAAQGYTDIVPVWDIIEAYPEVGIRNGWFAHHSDETVDFLDETSRLHYDAFVEWRKYRHEVIIAPGAYTPLPSTLVDIRARQKVTTWEHWLWGDGPSSVSIHAEGMELETIEKNLSSFIQHRPKIDVTVYHSRDGLWKIEKLLMDSLKDYRFEFRLHAYQGQGAYIYATPKERNE